MPSLSEETGGRVSMLMPGSTIGIIGGGQLGDVRVVVLGHDQHMHLRLGIDILERVRGVVLIYLLAGNAPVDDLAEQAVLGLAHMLAAPCWP